MRRYIILMLSMVAMLSSCIHKELCYTHRDHAHKYHVEVMAEYRHDWEEWYGGVNWSENWPAEYGSYDELRPGLPNGLRVVNYKDRQEYNTRNLPYYGGVVGLYDGPNDLLFYNNDTEFILFIHKNNGSKATTRATTRTRTRSTYFASEYSEENEETMTPPDMLYANYLEGYVPERVSVPTPLEVTLQPLVFTYLIRYEIEEGLEYAAITRGALTGMAQSVTMDTGDTSVESATLLYDCEITDFGAQAKVTSFGVPDFPNFNYPTRADPIKHGLNLEVMLRNGKILTFNFDVTDQVTAQPHGGVIEVGGIVINKDDATGGSGGFDVEVDDWGEYEDVILPII